MPSQAHISKAPYTCPTFNFTLLLQDLCHGLLNTRPNTSHKRPISERPIEKISISAHTRKRIQILQYDCAVLIVSLGYFPLILKKAGTHDKNFLRVIF